MSTENQSLEVVKKEKDAATQVLERILTLEKDNQLTLPKDYSVENALKAANLILTGVKNQQNQLATEICTKESIVNSLFKMAVLGLSVIKNQGSFIMYGKELQFNVEYAGNITLAKRFGNLKSIKANAIFDIDEFEFEINAESGRKKVTKHKQTLDSLGSKNLKGAYAVYELNNGVVDVEIMNIQQIKDAWNQGPMKGNSNAHKNFPDQMACKTVINRACKLLIRTSDDSSYYTEKEENDPEYLEVPSATENLKAAKKQYANVQEVAFDEVEQPQQEVAKIEVKAEIVKAEKQPEPVSKENQQTTIDEPNF